MMTIAETGGKSPKRILVVEDNEDNRDVVVLRLKAMGFYDVLEASNGIEALKIAARSKPDLIFMDLKMPIMDGWEATKALRETEWGKGMPIIALTAHTSDEDRAKAFHAGCNDFVAKPVLDYGAIQKKVQQLLIPTTPGEHKRTRP